MRITTADGAHLELDLALEKRWRTTEPVMLDVGPVLALREAVGSKLGALFRRTAARDFLDVDAIRRSGHDTDTVQRRLTAWAGELRS